MNRPVTWAKVGRTSMPPTRAIAFLCLLGVTSFAQSGIFTPTGSMGIARSEHTATLLWDGKVLIAGGRNDSSEFLNSAELYDPATGSFAPTGKLSVGRFQHTATLLPNGTVLIAGGFAVRNGPSLLRTATAELFDPATGGFRLTGSMAVGRNGHEATLLADGKVLITGDGGASRRSAELYDPNTETFARTSDMRGDRAAHSATLLRDGRVLVAGGVQGPVAAEIYDPSSGAFTLTGSMENPHAGHTATLLSHRKVLIAGGQSTFGATKVAEVYDLAAEGFFPTGSMIAEHVFPSATLLPNGRVLIVGDCCPDLYDPRTETFSNAGGLIESRSHQTATLLPDDRVLIAGGGTASAELYDPFVRVVLDIKPGDAKNTINLKSNATVLVAIFSSASFDATTVDPASVTLAGAHAVTQGKAGTPLTNLQDANRDGRVDLVLHFKTQDLQLNPGDTEAVLLGETFSGQSIRGADSIRLVP